MRFTLLALGFFSVFPLLSGCGDSAHAGSNPAPDKPAGRTETQTDPPSPKAVCPTGESFSDLAGKVGVKVRINEKGPFTFFLDTGAPTTVFRSQLAAEAASATIEAGGITTTLAKVGMDPGPDPRLPVDGVLGMDFIGDHMLTIDYPRLKWWVEAERNDAALLACDHVEGKPEEVPYIRRQYLFVRGGIESLDGWLLVDSGASLGGTLKSTFATLDAKKKRPALTGFYTPAAIGTFWAELTTLGSVRFGSHEVRSVLTRTVDDELLSAPKFPGGGELLGLFPSDTLRLFMVTIDPRAKTIRFDAEKGQDNVGAHKYYATGIALSDSLETHTKVNEVLEGSAAAEAGVVPGDEVVSVDGQKLASMDPYARSWGLVSPTEGMKITVVIRHGTEEKSLELEARDLLVPPAP
jgi:hypothetical protein